VIFQYLKDVKMLDKLAGQGGVAFIIGNVQQICWVRATEEEARKFCKNRDGIFRIWRVENHETRSIAFYVARRPMGGDTPEKYPLDIPEIVKFHT
jgi:HJR/Mrr/RecB family endonuclease